MMRGSVYISKYKVLEVEWIVSGLASTKQLHDKSQLFMKKERVGGDMDYEGHY